MTYQRVQIEIVSKC